MTRPAPGRCARWRAGAWEGHLARSTTRCRETVLPLLAHPLREALFISEKTASVHVSRILAKLDAGNRGEAAAMARQLGVRAEGG
jgi:ATP/maltotriose-dependent transcriptional regulator MalT